MRILAIDSSSAPASVAVLDDGVIRGEFTVNIDRTHSEKLLPLLDSLLGELGMAARDVDIFAISAGPGSFTGLRIGMSAAKLMAQTLEKPLIAVKTLESLAKNVNVFGGYICAMLDARNSSVYCAVYKSENGILREIIPSDAMRVTECCEMLSGLEGEVLFCGETEKYKELIKDNMQGKKIYFAQAHLTFQRASSTAMIAYENAIEGKLTKPEEIVPLYVRESQAEQARRAKEKMGS